MDSEYLSPNSGEHFSDKQLLFDVDSFNESLAFYFPNLPRNGLTTEKGSNQGEKGSVHYGEKASNQGSSKNNPIKEEKVSVHYREKVSDQEEKNHDEKGSNQGEKVSNQGSSKNNPIKEEKASNQGEKGSVLYRENEKPPEKEKKGSVLYMESSDDEKGSVLLDKDKNKKDLDFNIGYEYRIIKDIKEIIYSISFPEKNDLISSAEKRNLTRIQTENLIQIYTMIKLRYDHFKLNNRKNQEDTVVQIPLTLLKGITKSYKKLVKILVEDNFILIWNHGAKRTYKKTNKTKSGYVSYYDSHKQHATCYGITDQYTDQSLIPEYSVTIHISDYAWNETLKYFNMKQETTYITDTALYYMDIDPEYEGEGWDRPYSSYVFNMPLIPSYNLIADPEGNPVEAHFSEKDSKLIPESRIYSSFHFSHKKPCSWNDKYYRGNFTAFGEHLVEIFDIKSSVFTLMYCLPDLDCEDSERFHAFVMSEDIYKVLTDYLNDPDIDRDKMKELLSEYRNTGCDCKFTGSLAKIDEWFRSNFPVFRDKLLKYPCHYDKEQQRWIKNLQYDYMKVESEIIFYLRKCIINNWKCISWPLHDALYVIESDVKHIDRNELKFIFARILNKAKAELVK